MGQGGLVTYMVLGSVKEPPIDDPKCGNLVVENTLVMIWILNFMKNVFADSFSHCKTADCIGVL